MKIIKRISIFILIFMFLIILFINHYGPILGAQFGMPIYILPPSPMKYGTVALEIIDNNGYYANDDKWKQAKEKAYKDIKKANNFKEIDSIIEKALKQGGGKHSFLLTNSKAQTEATTDTMPSMTRENDIFIIKLPQLIDAQNNGKEYVEIVLKEIKKNKDMKGVVIDLRGNRGGDMGPMISAVSPFLMDGKILYFTDGKTDSEVVLSDGQSIGGGTPIDTNIPSFKIEVPVAVLMDRETASSAEAVLMAFMGTDRAKTFGQKSAGYASANQPFTLYNNTIMYLTTAYNKTIDGEIFYDNPIPPDYETNQPLKKAKEWLDKQEVTTD